MLLTGIQSALEPAGRGAEQIADLFWWMTAGAAVIWIAVIGLAMYVLKAGRDAHAEWQSRLLIVGGGAAFPVVALGALLAFGLPLTSKLLAPAPEGSLRIQVTGEQWWWRVRYLGPGGQNVELANEIRLPVNEPVQFLLDSADVIHAFWIPPLGGKMDMIPGRTNYLALHPTKTGVFRGACAEYCGGSHALMNFYAVVLPGPEFNQWLQHQFTPARRPATAIAQKGQEVFFSSGCGGCHRVRGTPANGNVGPDLTHVGSRVSVGAGILPSEPAEFQAWIARTERIKPEVHMPAFGMLPDHELRALAVYLNGLE